jgi:hypothetical protein
MLIFRFLSVIPKRYPLVKKDAQLVGHMKESIYDLVQIKLYYA